jgi:hypothetical protein
MPSDHCLFAPLPSTRPLSRRAHRQSVSEPSPKASLWPLAALFVSDYVQHTFKRRYSASVKVLLQPFLIRNGGFNHLPNLLKLL